jgi:hypothetical protein
MSHRIDVELTSERGDGTWTWRAAGARQPKGVVNGTLLPSQAKVGDVLRAEAEAELEGIVIIGVTPPKSKGRTEPERIEIVGSRNEEVGVTAQLARGGKKKDFADFDGKDRGGRRERGDRGDRGPGGDRRGGPGGPGGPRSGGPGGPGGTRTGGAPRRDADGRPDRARSDRRPSDRPRSDRHDGRGDRSAPPSKPRAKRLRAGRSHRQALVNQLPAEQRPLAELVLRGGVPLVRETLDVQRKAAQAQGIPAVTPGPVIDVAEKLAPHARLAEWQDRAEAALAQANEVDLRDLRSVVVAADGVARHEQTRETAEQLRVALTTRVEREHRSWLEELAGLVDEGRAVAALRLSSRPPKAGIPLPPPLATKLSDLVVAQLTPDTPSDRYAAVLDALAFSPVRTLPVPAELPSSPSPALLEAVKRLGDRIPQIAAAFGVEPAPPQRRGPARGSAGRGSAGRGSAGRGSAGRGSAGRGSAGRGAPGRGTGGRGPQGQAEKSGTAAASPESGAVSSPGGRVPPPPPLPAATPVPSTQEPAQEPVQQSAQAPAQTPAQATSDPVTSDPVTSDPVTSDAAPSEPAPTVDTATPDETPATPDETPAS